MLHVSAFFIKPPSGTNIKSIREVGLLYTETFLLKRTENCVLQFSCETFYKKKKLFYFDVSDGFDACAR